MKLASAFFTTFLTIVSQKFDYAVYYSNLIEKCVTDILGYQPPTSNLNYVASSNALIEDFGTFDYVIVGAGTTGSALARRLSEANIGKILVIEAGGEENDFSVIPAMGPYLQESIMSWTYTAKYSKFQRNNGPYPLGRALGGSSSIGNMLYTRGNPEDYDQWEKLGNEGWSFKDVLPYFIKSENFLNNDGSPNRGNSGLLNVTYLDLNLGLYNICSKALEEIDQMPVDYNKLHQIGFEKPQLTMSDGLRVSSFNAYLASYARKNIEIIENSLVTSLKIEDQTVKGVYFASGHKNFYVKVNKEVVLSAGAINTPQILMLSGIGPKDDLKQLGIDVVFDSPVGLHLKDKIEISFTIQTNETIPKMTFEDAIGMFIEQAGPLVIPEGTSLVGFINTQDIQNNFAVPDVQYAFKFAQSRNVTEKKSELLRFNISVVLLHPKSEGKITLLSKQILNYPNIDLNILSDQDMQDMQTLYQGIKLALFLLNTDKFKSINATLVPIDKCSAYNQNSKSYWYCAIKTFSRPMYEPYGTTKMGGVGDGVVSNNLKVYGMENLRIADTGVIPNSTSGGLMAVSVMIGEKLADEMIVQRLLADSAPKLSHSVFAFIISYVFVKIL